MAGIGIVIDPTSEDASNTQLDINDGATYAVIADGLSFAAPDLDEQWATSSDTEGSLLAATRHQNRQITIPLRVYGGTAAGLDSAVGALQRKAGKVLRERGTLKLTQPSGKTVVFDLLDAQVSTPVTRRSLSNAIAETTLTFTAKPYGRGAVQTFTTHTEATLPYLVFTDTGLAGDISGLGQLTITEAQGADQAFAVWGLQSRYYTNASTAQLAYQAEALTPLGAGAAAAAGPAGASGAGSNTILANQLSALWQAILSTQASGGGAHTTHTGAFQVWARVQTPTANLGQVSLAWQWNTGDFRSPTTNDSVWAPGNGTWRLVNLGQVTIPATVSGPQRWEGRLLAASTSAGDAIYVDYLMLIPVLEGYGEARALPPSAAPTSFTARDEFDQTAGALSGKTLPIGGTWSGAGDTDDFQTSGVPTGTTSGSLTRTATSDATATTGRYAIAGTTTSTNVAVQADVQASKGVYGDTGWPPDGVRMGVLARYVDTNNWLIAQLGVDGADSAVLTVTKRVAGAVTTLHSEPFGIPPITSGVTLRLLVTASGQWWVWAAVAGSLLGAPIAAGSDSDLATGGALASGKSGLYDVIGTATAVTRTYDNFAAWTATGDAAVYANRTLVIGAGAVVRDDSTGTYKGRVSRYEGDYLRVPPAGIEGRTVRVLVKVSRADPDTGADSAIDDVSAQLTVTPCYLELPE